jgi:ADP-ribose pyrophosphatase YjhB (NUDIX family)
MKTSAGIVLIKNNKILLCHPTNASWYGTYSIPKGALEIGENNINAAIRETSEEVGILIPEHMMCNNERYIDYKDNKGNVYKRVYYYVYYLVDDMPDVLPKEQLQKEEVDWAGFLDYESAQKKIFWRFKPILELIKPV